MDATSLILFLMVGLLIGWLGSTLMRGGGLGLPGNLTVGVVGAFDGGLLFSVLDTAAEGLFGSLITATAGAIGLLYIVGLIKKS